MQSEPLLKTDTLLARFRELASADPVAAALIDGESGRVTTRESLLNRGEFLARRFRESRLEAGDFVAVQLPNSVDFVAAFLGALEVGLTVVPIDRDARTSEVGVVLDHFAVRTLIYGGGPGGSAEISVRSVTRPSLETPSIPLLKLSSGSTGLPKGVLTTERNLLADCANICRTMGIGPHDINLGAIPFSHSYGFSNLVTPLLVQGTAVVISNDYLPLSTIALSNRFSCTVLPGIPMMFDHLSQLPRSDGMFDTIRTFISAGAPLSGQVSARFRERFGIPIHTFYGCSECGGISYDRDGGAVEQGTVGRPLDGVRLSLAGEGRLLVESEAVAPGYLRAPAEDSTRFSPGRYRTDDIGRIDDSGALVLIGRIGELINTAGKKVNPREIETVIREMPGVRDVKVYGEPAGARGEVVAAAVVADPDVTRQAIREYCSQRLSAFKVPRIVKLLEQIPLDERGKVRRAALAEL